MHYDDFGIRISYLHLKMMARGMKHTHLKLKHIKRLCGLKGRTAKACLAEYEEKYRKKTTVNHS